jgi:hypothetical protein
VRPWPWTVRLCTTRRAVCGCERDRGSHAASMPVFPRPRWTIAGGSSHPLIVLIPRFEGRCSRSNPGGPSRPSAAWSKPVVPRPGGRLVRDGTGHGRHAGPMADPVAGVWSGLAGEAGAEPAQDVAGHGQRPLARLAGTVWAGSQARARFSLSGLCVLGAGSRLGWPGARCRGFLLMRWVIIAASLWLAELRRPL